MKRNYTTETHDKFKGQPFIRFLSGLLTACLLSALLIAGCKKDDDEQTAVTLKLIADNIASPLGLIEAPDNSGRLFIIDQTGKIWIVNSDGSRNVTPFLDVTGKMVSLNPAYDERGLLGFAFHPDYKNNGKCYVFYTAPPRPGGPQPGVNWNNLTRISEFKVMSGNANIADPGSERIILEADHPQSNHNGGTIAFGPDGYLYISIGDGGAANDVGPGHVTDWYGTNAGGNAQNIHANLMGKILRIDVNSGVPYGIPADNPFAGTSAKGEIYAYGFRNPYRFSFDMGGSRELFVGDAGQKLWEEIDIVTKGGNYGWNVREGTACFNTDTNLIARPSCPTVDSMGKPLTPPFIQLKNIAHPEGGGQATVIVGGNVYRGDKMGHLQGRYIFGIFSQQSLDAKIFSATGTSGGYEEIVLQGYSPNLGMYLKGFGQDLAGEVYLTTSMQAGVQGSTGRVYKLVPAD